MLGLPSAGLRSRLPAEREAAAGAEPAVAVEAATDTSVECRARTDHSAEIDRARQFAAIVADVRGEVERLVRQERGGAHRDRNCGAARSAPVGVADAVSKDEVLRLEVGHIALQRDDLCGVGRYVGV